MPHTTPPTRPRVLLAALAAAAALTATGCTASPPAPAAAPTNPPATTATTATGAGDAGAVLPGAGSSPTWDTTSAAEAATAADRSVADYIRKDLDPDTWYRQLAPHLTPEAADAYRYTDPALVPGHFLTGGLPDAAPDGGSGFLARVPVSTDGGVITARLVRVAAGAPWQVTHFDLPTSGAGG